MQSRLRSILTSSPVIAGTAFLVLCAVELAALYCPWVAHVAPNASQALAGAAQIPADAAGLDKTDVAAGAAASGFAQRSGRIVATGRARRVMDAEK